MLFTWEAERLDRVLTSGRTKPILVECSQTDLATGVAESESFVVKTISNPDVTPASLFNEVVGNLLARKLGVNTPDAALVRITAEFAQAIKPTLSYHGYSIEPGIASGARYLGSSLIPPTYEILSPEDGDQAARIYAFDLLVQNPDRRIEKPNCVYHKSDIFAFDFELCFSFVLAIGSDDPCDFVKHGICNSHFFRSALRRRTVDWKPFLKSLATLSEGEIEEIINAVPIEWRRFQAQIEKHLKFMKTQGDRIELELQRSL